MGMASTTVHGVSSCSVISTPCCMLEQPLTMCRVVKPLVAGNPYNMPICSQEVIEPALKVFHRKRNFYHGILIALHQEQDGLSLLAPEDALIHAVRPQLNYPWVQDVMKALRIKQTRFRMPQARTGLRRIRKASALIRHHHGAYHTRIISNRDMFLALYRLGSDSVQKLKSQTDCAHMWYLYRPSIFVAGWRSSLMSLSGPEQSVSFD